MRLPRRARAPAGGPARRAALHRHDSAHGVRRVQPRRGARVGADPTRGGAGVVTDFNQIGYVVDDLDDALAYWVDVVGIAPFFVYRDFELRECFYEGEAITQVISVAFGQAGPVQVELIEQHGDTKAAPRASPSVTPHHLALCTPTSSRAVNA